MGIFGTTASTISDLGLISVQLSAIFGIIAWYFLKYKRRPVYHMILMFIGVLLLWLFLGLYVTNYLLNGVKTFGGPFEAKLLYYPFLLIHIIGSSIMGLLTAYQVFSGYKRFNISEIFDNEINEWAKFKFGIEYRKRHRSWGKMAVILWIFSAISGLLVYFLLYVLYSPEIVVIK